MTIQLSKMLFLIMKSTKQRMLYEYQNKNEYGIIESYLDFVKFTDFIFAKQKINKTQLNDYVDNKMYDFAIMLLWSDIF